MKIRILFPFLVLLALAFFPKTALADGIIIPDPPICDPGLCPPMPIPISQLEIRYHHVNVTIENQIAVTHVDQVFYNPNDWVVEGTYVFPIPHGAAVTKFVLWIDGQPVEGRILNAEEARKIYEEIVQEMKDPALLEYAGQDAVQARIYPIPPGGDRRIELEYSQVLESDNGLVRYLYPLNTEKFSTSPLDEVIVSVEVISNLPIRAAYSPSHPVDLKKDGQYHITAGYEERDVKPDTDFTFFYSMGENEAFHLMSFRDPSDNIDPGGFFTLLLAPRPDAGTENIPKDIILVLDRSGSMDGEKFIQAQSALKFILNHLNPNDRFNLIAFSTSIETFTRDMSTLDEVENAITWVNQLSALGSTDINRALLEAAAFADQERSTYIIFLTDGLPTEGVVDSADIIKNLREFAPSNLRLFVFGVGYDVDTYLLDSLAANHHGTTSYVLPGDEIDEMLSSFYSKISTPVLTELRLDFGEIDVYDLFPSPLPDLFDGSQITIVGRYRGSGMTDVTLTGFVNDKVQTVNFLDQSFADDSYRTETGRSSVQFIPRLWATRKIGFLLNQIRLNGPEQETIDQVVNLSIRYGIVTPYTSYLVTEPMPLGASEQDRIAEEQLMDLESAPSEPTYGQEAVEKSAAQGEMEGSDVAAAPMVEASNVVRVIGSRTFVLSAGTWMDTAFDPESMTTLKVAFLSDDYFSLAQSRRDIAAAFALGPRVIAISDGIVYEVVDPDAPTEKIEIPPTFSYGDQDKDLSVLEPPVDQDENGDNDLNHVQDDDNLESKTILPCLSGLLPLILLPLGYVAFLSENQEM